MFNTTISIMNILFTHCQIRPTINLVTSCLVTYDLRYILLPLFLPPVHNQSHPFQQIWETLKFLFPFSFIIRIPTLISALTSTTCILISFQESLKLAGFSCSSIMWYPHSIGSSIFIPYVSTLCNGWLQFCGAWIFYTPIRVMAYEAHLPNKGGAPCSCRWQLDITCLLKNAWNYMYTKQPCSEATF